MTRYLTDKEIENILDFIKPNLSIPKDCGMAIVKNTKDKLITQLKKQKIYPSIIPELKKQLELNYIKTRIDPGESVGILAAQSIGEKQTQNSIAYDEQIIIKQNNELIKINIGEFIDKYMEDFGFTKIDTHSHIKETKDIEIMTISQDEKIQWQNISEISRHAPKGNLVRVTTESGRSVVSTLSHSHLKKDKKNVVPVLGSDLKIGDRIPVIKRSPIFNSKVNKIDITKYIKNYTIGPWEYDSNGSTPLNSPTNKNIEYIFAYGERLIRYIEIDDNFINFLGAFIANGSFHYSNDRITLSNLNRYDSEFYEMIESFCLKYDLNFSCAQIGLYFFQSFKNNRTTEFTIRSKIFNMFLKSFLVDGSGLIRIPDFIFGLEKDQIELFLSSYFKDGGFTRDYEYLNKDVQFLLTYFGIYSRIVNNKLTIQYKYKDLFHDAFCVEINKNNLEEDFYILDDKELNDECSKLIQNFKKITDSDIQNTDENKKINTDSELFDLIISYSMDAHRYNENTFTTGKYFNVEEDLKYLYQVQNSDVVWERIIKLELIFEKDYNYDYVYDFSVKGNETFALFSGIVVHNTLNTLIRVSYTKSIASLIL